MNISGAGPIQANTDGPNPFRETYRTSQFQEQLQAVQEQTEAAAASPQQAGSAPADAVGVTPSGHQIQALPETRSDGTTIQWRQASDAEVAGAHIKLGSGYSAWIDDRNNLKIFGGAMSDEWQANRAALKAERNRAANLATLDAFCRFAEASGQSLAHYIEAQTQPRYHAASPVFGRTEVYHEQPALGRDQADALLALAKEQKLI
jgi:hypothetical protein